MLFERDQNSSQIHYAFAVKFQLLYCCTTRGRNAVNQSEIFAPGKMLVPSITAWVEEWNPFAREWVNRVNADEFFIVAPQARERQIIQIICSTTRTRNDVLAGERIRRVTHLADAVFTTAVGAFKDSLFQRSGQT